MSGKKRKYRSQRKCIFHILADTTFRHNVLKIINEQRIYNIISNL